MISHFSYVLLFVTLWTVAPQAPLGQGILGQESSMQWILQARILEWVAKPSSSGTSQTSDQICVSYVSCIGRRVLYPYCLQSPKMKELRK